MSFEHPIFYFDDKDIFDVIISEKKRISMERLVQFLLGKGVVVSRDTGRRELCDYIATWFRDYQTLDSLSLGEQKKRETTKFESEEVSRQNLEGGLAIQDVQSAVDLLKKSVSEHEQSLEVIAEDDGKTMNLVWTRDVIDHTKTPLRQRIRRTDRIQIHCNDAGKVYVRTPTDESCGELRTEFVKKLHDITGHELERIQIRLKENASPEERIKFFWDVLNGIPSFTPQTVIVVNLVSNTAETDDEGNDVEAEDQARLDFQGLVQAKLSGGRLLETPEYTNLKERGFSPSEIRWWATGPDGKTLVLFWFGFSNAKEGTGFFCNAVKVRHWSEERKEVLKTPIKPTITELNGYLSVLEETVRQVYRKQFQIPQQQEAQGQGNL
ncbi:MAG: hypothetical protein IKQ15_00400 [Kiritimatiellae bacterium]|nr:hypothetical protein [Kiritimatiellia bacterium]